MHKYLDVSWGRPSSVARKTVNLSYFAGDRGRSPLHGLCNLPVANVFLRSLACPSRVLQCDLHWQYKPIVGRGILDAPCRYLRHERRVWEAAPYKLPDGLQTKFYSKRIIP